MNDLEDEREIMMYLRHEAGHAFNYAYRLLRDARVAASCSARSTGRYRDHYRPVPFSRKFVRHIAGWYAQKHPDEDFAETFAVWLTPALELAARIRSMAGDRTSCAMLTASRARSRDQDPVGLDRATSTSRSRT